MAGEVPGAWAFVADGKIISILFDSLERGWYCLFNLTATEENMKRNIDMTTIGRNAASEHKAEKLAWGFRFLVETEMEALRIGYAYRNSPHGYKVSFAVGAQKYSVTIWNDKAKAMGCDV